MPKDWSLRDGDNIYKHVSSQSDFSGQGGPGHLAYIQNKELIINQILVTARQLSRIEVDRLHYQSSQGGAVKKKPKLLDGWEEDKHGLVSSEKTYRHFSH